MAIKTNNNINGNKEFQLSIENIWKFQICCGKNLNIICSNKYIHQIKIIERNIINKKFFKKYNSIFLKLLYELASITKVFFIQKENNEEKKAGNATIRNDINNVIDNNWLSVE